MSADSHCHLNDPAFDSDRDQVIEAARRAGVEKILNVGYDLPTSRVALELADEHDFIFAAVGIHPNNSADADEDALDELCRLGSRAKVVAIGETGLDYYRNKTPVDKQKAIFARSIEIAKNLAKPIVIHSRDAMSDTLDILRSSGISSIGGVAHCFSGSKDDLKPLLDLGLYISFAGVITFKKADSLREALEYVPSHRLLLETDAPYLAPTPHRGKRNEPTLLNHTLERAAEIRGCSIEDLHRLTVVNFDTLFKTGEAKPEGAVAYKIRSSLYINVTQSCSNSCPFCVRYHSDTVQGHHLRRDKDPTVEEMIEAIGPDPTTHEEIVFCGYGEPTIRLERILQVARFVKSSGARVRLNTNGHGAHLNGESIYRKMKGLIDTISVSLNAADKKTYDKVCVPLIPEAWERTVEFIKRAKLEGFDVVATVVAVPGEVDLDAAERFARDELGVGLRVREYNLTG